MWNWIVTKCTHDDTSGNIITQTSVLINGKEKKMKDVDELIRNFTKEDWKKIKLSDPNDMDAVKEDIIDYYNKINIEQK
jgi:hypothetical protein